MTLMKYRYLHIKMLCVLVTILMPLSVTKAQVVVDVRMDTLSILIGEPAKISLDVTCDAGAQVTMPMFQQGDMLVKNVEVLGVQKLDTQYVNDRKRMLLSHAYSVTSFDSSLYYLPPFQVEVDGKVYASKSLALRVFTLPIDTLNTNIYFGTKGVQSPLFTWDDWKAPLGYAFLLMWVSILAVYLMMRIRDNKPIIRIISRIPKLPPHQIAMKEIDKIKSERKWTAEDSKEYYTLLTDTLRTYIHNRYGFNAMEMTSAEIIDRLMSMKDDLALEELRDLFRTADLVKFAKYNTLINENDRNLVSAVEFINQTKVEVDPNAKPEQELVTVEEKRSKRYVLLLRVGILVSVLTSITLMMWIVWILYRLLY